MNVNGMFVPDGPMLVIALPLVILGLQSVKTLVLGFSLVPNLTKSQAKGFKHLAYWRRSIYAATAARSSSSTITGINALTSSGPVAAWTPNTPVSAKLQWKA